MAKKHIGNRFDDFLAEFNLDLLNDAIEGLQEIRAGKPSTDPKTAKARGQAKLDAAIAARKAQA